MSSENSQVTSAASKLSGLKAPSKIVRPTPLQKPIPTASVASSTPLSSSSLLSEVSLFKVGDRVIVNGNKSGVVAFIGEAKFKEGEWAGVELDEKLGKNDGSVNGKRYFKCEAMFGVFAPIQKVERLIDDDNIKAKPNILGTPAARSLQTASLKPKAGAVVTLKKELSGSQESINSMTSERSNISVSASQKSSALKRPSTIKPKMGVTVVSFLSFRLKFLFYFNFYLAKYSSKCLNFCCYRKKSTFN